MRVFTLLSLALLATPAFAQPEAASCSSPEYRQLNFWVGEWDLTWPGGQGGTPEDEMGEGVNIITKELGDCVIHETFSGDGFNGQSFSIYDARADEWRQTWVDDQGGHIAFTGGMAPDGTMFFQTASFTDAQSNERINRMIWEGIARARLTWRWQTSTDNGETWNDLWVISYTRR